MTAGNKLTTETAAICPHSTPTTVTKPANPVVIVLAIVLKAKESKVAHIIALILFLIGTALLLILLWDKIFSWSSIYTYAIFGLPILIPSIVFTIILQSDRMRVRNFNQS